MGIMGMTREMSAGYNVARLITTRGDRAPVTKTPKGGYTNPCTTIGSAVAHWATTATNELLPNRQLWRAGENGDAQFQVENDAYFGQLSQYFVNYFVGAASYLREGGATPSVLGTFFGEVGRDLYHFDWGWEGYGRALLNPKTMYDIVNLLAFSNEREIFEFLALHKNRIHAVTSAQIHDVVSQVWFSNSRLFNYFADIIKRGDLPIIDGQSYADSIKDVCKYHSQTHDTIVILTPNPDIYKDVNIGVTVIPIEPEQFKKFVMDEDEDFMKHCKEFK